MLYVWNIEKKLPKYVSIASMLHIFCAFNMFQSRWTFYFFHLLINATFGIDCLINKIW